MHADLPDSAFHCPALQDSHLGEPLLPAKLPMGHSIQLALACLLMFWNLPTWQSVQFPMDAYLPDEQLFVTQDARVSVAGTVEAGQVLQDGFPVSF